MTIQVVTELFAWLGPDASGGDGILLAVDSGMVLPLVFVSRERAEKMRPWAEARAGALGVRVRLVRLMVEAEIDAIDRRG